MNSKETPAKREVPRIWIDYEAGMTLFGCIMRFHRNNPLISNLEEIFSYLCSKFETLCNFQCSLHLFVNRSTQEVHLLIPNKGYKRLTYRDNNNSYNKIVQLLQLNDRPRGVDVPSITALESSKLRELFDIFDIKSAVANNSLLIPFDYGSLDMGIFVLWEQDNPRREMRKPNDKALRGWVASYYSFLKSFLVREYSPSSQTYLPSYYSVRWAKVAILFADIRNFTPLTEILRNVYARPGEQETKFFKEIMDEHCREMARIIQESGRGRIDKFLGDGIMAIFGEHEIEHSKMVCRAVSAAAQMVERFQKLRPGFLSKAFGGEYEIEYNESVEIELGVGIDYGTVLFEYLGDERHREYTAIGDHVNFAQRLESEAARIDERTGNVRPPILISPTAERCIRPWLNNDKVQKIILYPKGKSRFYTVYGITPEDFDRTLYNQAERHDDWTTAWDGYPCCSPNSINAPP